MKIYDLDGTLSKANSTFDFIKLYHQENNKLVRLFFAEVVRKVLNRTSMTPERKRRVMIRVYFSGLKKSNLEHFFYESYLNYFKKTLTSLGKYVLQQDNHQSVMLTGCTVLPAELLGSYFGFGKTISTTFSYKGEYIKKIDIDSFGNKKIPLIEQYLVQNSLSFKDVTYYTDDPDSEDQLIKLFNDTRVV